MAEPSDPNDPQRRYWWQLIVALPIFLALIPLAPSIIEYLHHDDSHNTQENKGDKSTNELIKILEERERIVLDLLDTILAMPITVTDEFQPQRDSRFTEEKLEKLKKIRKQLVMLNKKRLEALRENNYVLAQELDNEIDQLPSLINSLIGEAKINIDSYNKLYEKFSTMSKEYMEIAYTLRSLELKRLNALSKLTEEIMNYKYKSVLGSHQSID